MSSARRHPSELTRNPGGLGSFRRILRLCTMGRVECAYFPRLLGVSLTSLLSSPLRLWEHAALGGTVKRTAIHPSPIFILGHWRSGTTHLQNLICQDAKLGYLTGFQAIAPGFCLVGRGAVQRVLRRVVESVNPTRPMDNVAFSLDAPQEDDYALANVTAHSFAHAFILPRQAEKLFQRYVLFGGLPERTRLRWIEMYLTLMRKVTLASGGKRLILKNCTNTARIPMLLDLFPDSKFIHIVRNPYDVFVSTVHLHESLLAICQLQSISPGRIRRHVLTFYRQLMQKYLADRALIPSGNLVEVRYEDLEREPLRQIRRIYEELGLPGFPATESLFRSYIESLARYAKNEYVLEPEAMAEVSRTWYFAFEHWGYDLR